VRVELIALGTIDDLTDKHIRLSLLLVSSYFCIHAPNILCVYLYHTSSSSRIVSQQLKRDFAHSDELIGTFGLRSSHSWHLFRYSQGARLIPLDKNFFY
jgi:hypothetical protein